MFNDCEPVKKDKAWTIVIIVCAIVLVLSIILMIGVVVVEQRQYDEWYASLSEEEKLKIQQEKEAAYQANIHKYEVVSVAQYVKTETNRFGGIIDTEICYTFNYLDGQTLKSVESFQHLEYGLTKITIGDTNCYIVNTNGETTRTLQLTKETLNSIQTLNAG